MTDHAQLTAVGTIGPPGRPAQANELLLKCYCYSGYLGHPASTDKQVVVIVIVIATVLPLGPLVILVAVHRQTW